MTTALRLAVVSALAVCVLGSPARGLAFVRLITIDGTINPAVADFVRESLVSAKEEGAEALVIELDTPGGLLTATKHIVKEILGAPLPVIVYVAPSGAGATSAGVFITMAAHVAAMAPGTTIGAAHPVGPGGNDAGGSLADKIENFTVSFGQSIAERRGRNVQWAEKAVRKSVSITETEAVAKRVVDLVAPDLPTLLKQVSGRKVRVGEEMVTLTLGADTVVERREMSLRHRVLNLIADPNVAYLLFLAGLLGLYFEFANPGTVFPGVVGGICLLLSLAAFQVLPIKPTGILLILLALGLLLAEAFIPSFGILGVGGIVAFVLGSLFLFDTTDPTAEVDRAIIVAAVLTVSSFVLAVGYLVVRAQRGRVRTASEGLVGEFGVVRERLENEGKIFVHGEYWTAVSDCPVDVGERVEVLGLEPGMRLRVRRAEAS